MKSKKSVIKIILFILGFLVIFIGVSIFSLYSTVTTIDKAYPSNEILLKGGEKQALLIYEPSKSKLSESVALKAADAIKNNGYTVTINYPSDELNYDLEKYDVIVFGSPVYAGKTSSVLKDYMSSNIIENKKILLYSIGKFEDKKDELNDLKACISSNNIIEAEKYTENSEKLFLDFIKKHTEME